MISIAILQFFLSKVILAKRHFSENSKLYVRGKFSSKKLKVEKLLKNKLSDFKLNMVISRRCLTSV